MIKAPFGVPLRGSLRVPILMLLGAASLAACAGGASVKGGWQGSASHDQSFHRVLIVGLSSDYDQRCAFEFSLMSQLNTGTPIAGASCDFLKPEDPLTRANIEKVVAATHADAVLTTKVVDSQFKAVQGAGMDAKGGAYYKVDDVVQVTTLDGGYGVAVSYGDVVQYPPITTVEGQIHLVTRVYDTRNASLVYTVQTKADNIDSQEDFLLDVTPVIADHLRSDGVIR